jgi:hypothetical protein
MGTYGINVRYYPRGIISPDQHLAIEVTEWQALTPIVQHENITEHMDIGPDEDVDPNDLQWILTVLEAAAQVVENRIHARDAGFISGANGSGDLASGNASQQM